MERRHFLKLGAAATLMPALTGNVLAQSLTNITVVIPTGPGGGWDITGRSIATVLRGAGLINSARIDNVPGAGGTVGLATFVNQQRGKGQSILVSGLVMVTNIISNKSPIDLSMVTPLARLTGEYQAIAVPANSKYKDLASFLTDFKANPRGVSWVGGSAGGTDHLVAAMIAKASGLDPAAITYVGYPSGGEIQAAVLGAQATAGVSGLSEFSKHVAGGGMRLLGVTAPQRISGVDAPTLREAGLDVEVVNWRGLFAAPGISAQDRSAWLTTIDKMVKSDLWTEELKNRDWTNVYLTGDAFGTFVTEEATRIRATLKELGLA